MNIPFLKKSTINNLLYRCDLYFNNLVNNLKFNHLKKVLPLYILLFTAHFSFSQNSKILQGKVLFKENPLRDVEVINWNKKTITKTDADGIFYIETAENDTLYFLSKNHLDKKIGIKKSDFQLDIFKVNLTEKTVDLEEITIIKNQSIKITVKEIDRDIVKLEKSASRPENESVDMNTIKHGANVVRIFKEFFKIFKKKDEPKPIPKPAADFKKFVQSKFDTEYFVKTLNLKPDEISKFIAFCNEDAEARKVVEHSNILTAMDFLAKKNKEFKLISK